eukprot:1160606-Pelagomonas_calceolata.AAC.4
MSTAAGTRLLLTMQNSMTISTAATMEILSVHGIQSATFHLLAFLWLATKSRAELPNPHAKGSVSTVNHVIHGGQRAGKGYHALALKVNKYLFTRLKRRNAPHSLFEKGSVNTLSSSLGTIHHSLLHCSGDFS